jgi:DnaJ-class molecular chaperone
MDPSIPYHILNLPLTATEKEIRQAYRRLAKKFHPDRNPGKPEMEEQFKEIQQAYETLLSEKDENKKGRVAVFHHRVDHSGPDLVDPFLGFYQAVTVYLRRNQTKGPSPLKGGDRNGNS